MIYIYNGCWVCSLISPECVDKEEWDFVNALHLESVWSSWRDEINAQFKHPLTALFACMCFSALHFSWISMTCLHREEHLHRVWTVSQRCWWNDFSLIRRSPAIRDSISACFKAEAQGAAFTTCHRLNRLWISLL